jgi:hypothetical protein
MQTLCQQNGHSYVYTSAGKSSRCIDCHDLRMPWHTESESSINAGLSLRVLLDAGK